MHASECQLNIRSSVPVSVLFRVTIHPSFFSSILYWDLVPQETLSRICPFSSLSLEIVYKFDWGCFREHRNAGRFVTHPAGVLSTTPLGGLADCPDVLPCGLMFRMYGHLVSVAH